jgi:chromate reductase, NAD(P)H dehydrogenase (quinone)
MPIVQQPEAYIGNVSALFDENGKIKDNGTVQFLQTFVNAIPAKVDVMMPS